MCICIDRDTDRQICQIDKWVQGANEQKTSNNARNERKSETQNRYKERKAERQRSKKANKTELKNERKGDTKTEFNKLLNKDKPTQTNGY